MAKRVLVQGGHYPGGGGAPGEAEWTWKLAGLLRSRLEAAGVECVVIGDWYYGYEVPAVVQEDYDLFVALHYDAAVYGAGNNTGCFADRAAADPMWQESDRAIRAWEAVYPAATGIPLRNERRNANTFDYYGFRDTTATTPGILIEHGCGAPVSTGNYPPGQDAPFLHGQIDRVADADARAILAFLGATTGYVLSTQTTEEPEDMATIAELEGIIVEQGKQIAALREEVAARESDLGALRHDALEPLEAELRAVKDELAQCQSALAQPAQPAQVSLEAVVTFADGRNVLLPVTLNAGGRP